MRILQIIQQKQYRGAEIFCCQLSNHLLHLGHEVEIFSIYNGDASLPFIKEVKSLERKKNRRYYDFYGWKKLASIVADFKPDVVQANAADTLKYVIFSRLLFRWQTPVVFRNASASSFYIKDALTKKLNSYLLQKADMIISVSHASKSDINSVFPFTRSKSLVIPVGVEVVRGEKNESPGYIEGTVNLLHVGSFTKEKNHLELLSIFEGVKADVPEARLHLIGGGPLFDLVSLEVTKRGLEDYVNLYGEIKKPMDYIRQADLLLLPSLIEGLPAVLLEAMYCRTPVVAYDVGGVREILKPNSGCLIEKGNVRAFISAVKKSIEEPNFAEMERSYEIINQYYLNSLLAKIFLKSYKKLNNT